MYKSVIEAQSSACLLLDKHLEVLKLLMAAAECRTSQLQPHFLDPPCQSGCCPEHMGGPVSHRGLEKEKKGAERIQVGENSEIRIGKQRDFGML